MLVKVTLVPTEMADVIAVKHFWAVAYAHSDTWAAAEEC
jgi:hypothetical protein